MMDGKLLRRLERLEAEHTAPMPLYRVAFEDGSRRVMPLVDLEGYAISRQLRSQGETPGGILPDAPLAYTEYRLIEGSKIPALRIFSEIEQFRGI